MLIRARKASDVLSSEITSHDVYQQRRDFIIRLGAITGSLVTGITPLTAKEDFCSNIIVPPAENPNKYSEITHYNNFYEYSTNKEAIAELAKNLVTEPWTINIEGEVEKPLKLDINSLLSAYPVVDRTYRMRCVEGWSMVIPWQGIQLCNLIKKALPTSKAKYVEFIGKHDPDIFYGQRRNSLQWPYREALRIDEAMHPLTILATGLYGKSLPNQNGAPLRLVVPWKYGFKGIKSIVTIKLVEHQPSTSWALASPSEYGFYANVNPNVSHPRWSQRRENRIGEIRKIKTLPFNGYAEEVASLYKGMDLSKFF